MKKFFLLVSLVALTTSAAFSADYHPLKTPNQTVIETQNPLSAKLQENKNEKIETSKRFSVENTATCQLDFNIQVPDNMWQIEKLTACSLDEDIMYGLGGKNENFPQGRYDIVASCSHINTAYYTYYDKYAIVILENQEINGDTTLTLDLSTATNELSFVPTLENDDLLEFPHVELNDRWEEIPVSPGNMDLGSFTFLYMISGGNWSIDLSNSFSPVVMDPTPMGIYDPYAMMKLYINEVSDRIIFNMGVHMTEAGENGSSYYLRGAQKGISETSFITNSPDTYKTLIFDPSYTLWGRETEELLELPQFKNVYPYGIAFTRFNGINAVPGYSYVTTNSQSQNIYKVKYSVENDKVGNMNYILAPVKGEIYKQESEYYQISNVGGTVNLLDAEGPQLCILPPTEFNGGDEEGLLSFTLPGNTTFASPLSLVKDVDFATAPALVSYVGIDAKYGTYYTKFKMQYVGRLNEDRFSDTYSLKANMTLNGEPIALSYDDIIKWWNDYSEENAGEIVVKLDNGNFETDDVEGGNSAVLTFDMRKEDNCPPTLTMLQFRDKEDIVTSNLNQGDEGTIIISAADFTWHAAMENNPDKTFYIASAPAEIKVEIALHGTDDFTEINLEQKEDGYYPYYFGGLYSTSLECANEIGWYDVRISLADEAGNTQVQTVKCAFHISCKTSAVDGINTETQDKLSVYNLQGIKVLTATNLSDVNSLPKGIYIVNGKKVIVK